MRKKIYILYPDDHLSYSPSVLNLYDELSRYFDVTIFSNEPNIDFNYQKPADRNVYYLRKPGTFKRLIFATLYLLTTNFLGWPKMGMFRFKRQMNVLFLLKTLPVPDAVIGVDLMSVWTAQKLPAPVHLLSLEINENDIFKKTLKKKLTSVLIQSEERYRYYFPERGVKVFYVQNAPVYRESNSFYDRKGLIYNGTAAIEFGVFYCIDFVLKYKKYFLQMKGAVPQKIKAELELRYKMLLQQGCIAIDNTYIETKDLTDYLAHFRIGFCFYDTSIEKINTFNYLTAPSGKLFAYLAAGTPVIVNDIRGLNVVNEFKCGVMIKEMDPETIYAAVTEIETHYETYSANCILAAKHYSFDKNIAPFIDFLQSS
ncbi:MAG: hypothetical protein WKF89_13955 [Chitinophagaceae bacterium]